MTASWLGRAGPAASDESDAALLSRSERDPEMFARLYDRHAPNLHRYVTRRLGYDTADDIVAETFLTAFRARRRFDPGRVDALPWLYGIAANLIGKHRRAEIRMHRAFARTGAGPAESYTDGVEARVAASGLQRTLAAALADLSAGDREVLLLVAWADLTYEQVAEALDIPVGTVRSRLHRARRKVRGRIGEHDPTTMSEDTDHE
jgi:RNA polymerase sigma factor (sigma-70 family)